MKYIYNTLLIGVLVAHGVVVELASQWKAVRASVITAFTCSSDALISRVVLLSRM